MKTLRFRKAIKTKDTALCKSILKAVRKAQRDIPYENWQDRRKQLWKDCCNYIQYPYDSAFDNNGYMSDHFRGILMRIKTIALTN